MATLMRTEIVIPATIADVRELKRRICAYKADMTDPRSEVIEETENLGWFIRMQGSYEHLYVGDTRPDLAIGDKVRIRICKEA